MTALPAHAVDFRGHPACPDQVIWIPAFEHELQRQGIITGPLDIAQLIGFFAGSGNTHGGTDAQGNPVGGGASDFWLTGNTAERAVAVARQMGADATWHRLAGWDNGGGSEHVHCVLRGCPHLTASAAAQYVAVDHNGDGLVGTIPDPGPRPLSGRTWREGIAWAQQQEDDVFNPDDKAWLIATIDARLVAFGKNAGDLLKVDDPRPDAPKNAPKWSLSTAVGSLFKRIGA